MKSIKLYRGLDAAEFKAVTGKSRASNRRVWQAIVSMRATGDFSYPANLDKDINQLHRNLRLERQFFTDNKLIAKAYASKVSGLLVEVTVPVQDVIKHFDVEFQNFGRRRKQFEIVYCVKGALLSKRAKVWKMKVTPL